MGLGGWTGGAGFGCVTLVAARAEDRARARPTNEPSRAQRQWARQRISLQPSHRYRSEIGPPFFESLHFSLLFSTPRHSPDGIAIQHGAESNLSLPQPPTPHVS